MKIITKNKSNAVGIATELGEMKDVGEFQIGILEEGIAMAKIVFGDGDVHIRFKLSSIPSMKSYLIAISSVDSEDPAVIMAGKYRDDGKHWGEP